MADNNSYIATNSAFPPSGWVETTLGEVCESITDGTHSTVIDKEDGDCFLLSCKNIKDGNIYTSEKERKIDNKTLNFLRKRTKLQKNDVLLTSVGTIGEVAYIKDENPKYEFQRSVAILKPNITEINYLFLFYYLKSKHKHLNLSAEGAVQKCLFIGRIKEFPILLPPLPEQQAIASVLSAFDDKIELLREQNKTLEEIGQTIFKEWFGKYSPERPEELPEGWRVGKLGEVCSLKSGFAFRGDDFVEKSNSKVLKIKDLKGSGVVDLTDVSFVKDEIKNLVRVQYFKLQVGDIVLAMSGNTTGKIGIIPNLEEDLFLNQRVGKIFVDDEKLRIFIYFFLMSGSYEEKILSKGYGSAQPNINPAQIGNIDCIYPNDRTLENFINATNPIFTKILDNRYQIQILTRSRDELLPRLMSGLLKIDAF